MSNRLRLVTMLLGLGGCSLLFDPSKTPHRCTAVSPANPDSLVATVGKTGVIEWTWPSVVLASTYRLCVTSIVGTELCRTIKPSENCRQGTCSVSDNRRLGVRFSGRVQSVDECGVEGAVADAPTASATAISTTTPDGWILESSCPTTTYSVSGGLLSLEQFGFLCLTSYVTGDELWGDFTIDAEVLAKGDLAVGLALHSNATGHRLLAVTSGSSAIGVDPAQLRARDGTAERVVASSIHPLIDDGFTHFRITSRQGVISWQLGVRDKLAEIIRWPDSSEHSGRFGIAAYGNGRVEVKNLVVHTKSTLVALGPSAFSLDLADGGHATKMRVRGPSLSIAPCPSFGDACGGTCSPAPGAACARLEPAFLNSARLGVDLPTGLDPRRPWALDLRFATPPDAGNMRVLDSAQGALLLADQTDTTGLDAVYDADGGLPGGQWHTARWRFEPDAGKFDVWLDGQTKAPTKSLFPPASHDRFLGVLTLGYVFNGWALYVSDLHVSQEP